MSGKAVRDAVPMVCVMLFFAAVVFLFSQCLGCIPQVAKEKAAEEAYKQEQLDCVRQYDSGPEIRACVQYVRARWSIDGGAR